MNNLIVARNMNRSICALPYRHSEVDFNILYFCKILNRSVDGDTVCCVVLR